MLVNKKILLFFSILLNGIILPLFTELIFLIICRLCEIIFTKNTKEKCEKILPLPLSRMRNGLFIR